MESLHLLMHANWGHEPTCKRALTPSPSPTRLGEASGVARVGWERVAASPGEGLSAFRFPLSAFPPRFMESEHFHISDAHWKP